MVDKDTALELRKMALEQEIIVAKMKAEASMLYSPWFKFNCTPKACYE